MNAKIKCLVVDDEPLAREGIAGYVQQVDFLELSGQCESAVEAMGFLKNNTIDLLFLDIQMPGLTGLDLVRSLPHPPLIIFTTAYANYAVQGFELDAIDYLLKPVAFARFLKAVNKAADSMKEPAEITAEEDYFFIKEDKRYIKINFDDIIFIEGVKDYVKIHTVHGTRHLVLINMKNIQLRLPSDKFMRVHKSFIVATGKINLIEGNIVKAGGHDLAIGKEYKDALDELIKKKLIRRGESPAKDS